MDERLHCIHQSGIRTKYEVCTKYTVSSYPDLGLIIEDSYRGGTALIGD